MTGYESKKKAASAKTIDEVNWADHEPDGRRAAQEPAQEKYTYGTPLLDAMTKNYVSAQEPVAWRWIPSEVWNEYVLSQSSERAKLADEHGLNPEPLYTTQPQRPWVGLTAEEAAECWTTSATQTWKNFETKLKDKNNGT